MDGISKAWVESREFADLQARHLPGEGTLALLETAGGVRDAARAVLKRLELLNLPRDRFVAPVEDSMLLGAIGAELALRGQDGVATIAVPHAGWRRPLGLSQGAGWIIVARYFSAHTVDLLAILERIGQQCLGVIALLGHFDPVEHGGVPIYFLLERDN